MNCPDCGKRTYVTNSRHADSTSYRVNQVLLATAEELCSWYSRDWVVRKRICKKCTWEHTTIEVLAVDFDGMMESAASGKSPWGEGEET